MVKLVDRKNGSVDYRFGATGLRVTCDSCQLLTEQAGEWRASGQPEELPVAIPVRESMFVTAENRALRDAAYQYHFAHPHSDIVRALAKRLPL